MKETRRFLRYVIPGLVFIIEVSLYLCLFSCQGFVKSIKDIGNNLNVNIAFPVLVFLASGGIGFFLGVIYHTIFGTAGFQLLAVDHRPLIEDVDRRGWLRLQRRGTGITVNATNLTQPGAWRIVNSFWHERTGSSERIKAANQVIDYLTDIMHGLGIALIGSVIAVLAWLFIHFKFPAKFPWLVPCERFLYIIPFIIIIFHFINFQRVAKNFQSVVDIIISDELQEEFSKKGKPTIINVAQIDYRE